MLRLKNLSVGAIFALALLVTGVASAATAVVAKHKAEYVSLKSAGVSASGAVAVGRNLKVSLKLRHRTDLRFAIVSGKNRVQVAWNGPNDLAAGRHTVLRRLHGMPKGSNFRLRITARVGAKDETPARGFLPITVAPSDKAPTGISLSSATVAENLPAGSAVGTLSAKDANKKDRFTYAFSSGNGDTDNGLFAIDGATLRTAAPLDFEAGSTRSVRLRVTDLKGHFHDSVVAIYISDVDETPKDFSLSAATVAENQPAGTAVGTLSGPDAAGFALVSGAGDADNGAFAIDGTTLRTATGFDFEARSAYSVRIRMTDAHGLAVERAIAITVTDAPEAPTALDLSSTTVVENQPAGTAVGTLSSVDPDAGEARTYALISGTGSDDNGSFDIDGATLRTHEAFDFEVKSSYKVRIRVSDGRGGSFERAFTITVSNQDDPPADLALDNQSVDENEPAGTTVGELSATDPDGDPLEFSLVSGTGDDDNDDFAIDGTTLETDAGFDAETKDDYSVRVRVSDGLGGTAEEVFAITVDNVDEAPQVFITSGTVPYVEDDPAVAIDPALGVTDVDSTTLSGATVAITGGFHAAEDVLAFADTADITGAWNAATGTLTLTGDASPAAYRDALRAVTYANTSQGPSGGTRTVSLVVTDDDGLDSAAATRDIAVTSVVDPPMVVTSDGSTGFTEDGAAVAVDPGLTVSDADSTELTGAIVEIATPRRNGDELRFVDQNGIHGATYNAGTGQLELSGTASIADYQTALRSITFTTAVQEPSSTRTVSFRAKDSDVLSDPATKTIEVTGVNDPPEVHHGSSFLDYTELAGPVATDADLTITDIDSELLKGATVQIGTGFDAAQDVLAFADQLGITGVWDDTTGTLTLTGIATLDDYQAALRAVTYENTSANPAPPYRTLHYTATDAAGDTSADAPLNVEIGATNDAATVTTTGSALAYTENDPDTAVDGALTVTDPDDASLEGARVRISAGRDSGDVLALTDESNVSGTYTAATGTLQLTGVSSVANYQAALRSVTFRSTNDDPTPVKTIEFSANDGDGLGPASVRNLDVTRVNDAPVLTPSGGSAAFTENGGPVAVDTGITISDVDSTTIASAFVSIDANFNSGQDSLGFLDQNGIQGSYNAATGVLALTGTASLAEYQTALRSVTFDNSSEGPTTGARTVSFTVSDGAATSTTASRSVTVTGVNDAPVAVDDAITTDEDTTKTVAAPGVLANDTDLDPGDTKTVVKVNGAAPLTVTTAKGATVTVGADGSVSYNPGSAFQGLATGETGTDSFTYTMADGAGAQSTATVNVTIDGVSDAPQPVADSVSAVGNTALYSGTSRPASLAGRQVSGSLLDNDVDPDTAHGSLVVESVTNAATTRGGKITIAADGTFTYVPPVGDTGVTDTFSYRVCDTTPCNNTVPSSATATLSLPISGQVWYVDNRSADSQGTSTAPFSTLAAADAASSTGDTAYVFKGDGTTAGLTAGYTMASGERLLGEVAPLVIGSDTLFAGTANARPKLTATNKDVVTMASSATLRGVDLDPTGNGGGVYDTGAGTTVTIDDVRVLDTGPAGNQPGLELDTSGGATISDLTVSTVGATGVRLNAAGNVQFTPSSTVSITTSGAKGLDSAGTNLLTSQFDDITVTGSAVGGVSLAGGVGTPSLGDGSGTDLALTTTSGTTPALSLSPTSGSVTVDAAGTDTLSATGGPALQVSGLTGGSLTFDSLSSANSASTGVTTSNTTAAISAAAGAITNAATAGFDIAAGSGNVTYGGTITDDLGYLVSVQNQTGGTKTFSGALSDGDDADGNGIRLLNNTGGTTRFDGGLILSTATQPAFTVAGNGGTLVATGANKITTTTGTPLTVTNTAIGAGGLTFSKITSNGAANGIVLANTGSAGGLTVTGSGFANSGGTIQGSTGAGVLATSVGGLISLSRMDIKTGQDDGVRVTSSTGGLTLNNTIVEDNGNAVGENGLDLTDLTGATTLTSAVVTGSAETNARLANTAGTATFTATGSTFSSNSAALGAHGLELRTDNNASLTSSVTSSTFTANRDNAFLLANDGGSPAMSLTFGGNSVTGGNAGAVSGQPGIVVAPTASATTKVLLDNNTVSGTLGRAIIVNPLPASTSSAQLDATVTNNVVGTAAAGSGSSQAEALMARAGGNGHARFRIANNTLQHFAQVGMWLRAQEGSGGTGTADFTVTGNTVRNPDGSGFEGIYLSSGATAADNMTVCADLSTNTFAGTGTAGFTDLGVSKRFATTLRLPGYSGGSLQTYIQSRNPGGPTATNYSLTPDSYAGTCAAAVTP